MATTKRGSDGAPKFSTMPIHVIKTMNELQWVTQHPLYHRTPDCDFIEYRILRLTREMQQLLLSRIDPKKQRSIKGYHLMRIEEDIADGLFVQLGNPMHLCCDGTLRNAMHRLTALLRAGLEPDNQILHVLTEEWMADYLDINTKEKTLVDTITLMGHLKFPKRVLTPLLYEATHWKVNRQSTLRQAHLLLSRDDLLRFGHEMFFVLMNVWGHGSVGGLIAGAVACARVDMKEARKYFTHAYRDERCIDGVYRPEMKELHRVVQFCISKDTGLPGCASFPRGGDPLVKYSADFAIRCWNAYRTGEPLEVREGEPLVPRSIDMAIPV